MNITEHWLHQIKTLAYDSSEPLIVKGLTKLRIGHRFRIPGEDWLQGCSHDLVDLSYKSNESKIRHLERNYFDKDRYDMFLEKLDLRSDMGASILTFDFGHKPKRAKSQGYCLNNLTLVVDKKRAWVFLNYRSTEITQKFGADLYWLYNNIIPPLIEGKELQYVDFTFGSAYSQGLFTILLFQFMPAKDVMDFVVNCPHDYWRHKMLYCIGHHASLPPGHEDKFRAQRRMHEYYYNYCDDLDYCYKVLKKEGYIDENLSKL